MHSTVFSVYFLTQLLIVLCAERVTNFSIINSQLFLQKMHYILVTELLSPGEDPVCKVQGLPSSDLNTLESCFMDLHLTCKNLEHFIEVDFSGVDVLNILCGLDFGVVSQCMAIEITAIGGRTMRIQKIFWTMAKE